MKKIQLVIAILILFCSCGRKSIPVGKTPDKHPKPFVTLRNGTTIEPQMVTPKGAKLKTDSVTYKVKEVEAYSDGKSTYALIKGRAFAPRIYEGDINVYRAISKHYSSEFVNGPGGSSAQAASYNSAMMRGASPGGHWEEHQHKHVNYYVQKAGTKELKSLTYRSLKDMIPAKEPAFKYLELYTKHKRVDRIIMGGGFVVFVAGVAVFANSINSSKGAGPGGAIMLTGAGAMITGAIMNTANHLNLMRAVAKHNGVLAKN